MLLIFCNLVEVMRLREKLVLDLTETSVLTEIYDVMKDLVNRSSLKYLAQSPIPFQAVDGMSREQINFFEDGSLSTMEVDLAVNEFDPSFKSNVNFMNSESVQCLVLDSGVQELRAVVHY